MKAATGSTIAVEKKIRRLVRSENRVNSLTF